MTRLQRLDPSDYRWLEDDDVCFHYGDYTADGGYQASETNQLISNLKKKPTAPAAQLIWKMRAIQAWGLRLRQLLPPEKTANKVTFVPFPGSKPAGHPEFDDRMLKVLQVMAHGYMRVDIRSLLVQTQERDPQHMGQRLTPDDLLETLAVDPAHSLAPVKSTVLVVDDIITMGASFAAAKRRLLELPGVRSVQGIFLARTVWTAPDFSDYFDDESLT